MSGSLTTVTCASSLSVHNLGWELRSFYMIFFMIPILIKWVLHIHSKYLELTFRYPMLFTRERVHTDSCFDESQYNIFRSSSVWFFQNIYSKISFGEQTICIQLHISDSKAMGSSKKFIDKFLFSQHIWIHTQKKVLQMLTRLLQNHGSCIVCS